MKLQNKHHLLATLLCVVFTAEVRAQGTAFTYQGRLDSGGSPATGTYDLRFTIYDSSGGVTVIGGPITNAALAVSNGLFTVPLDFGAGVFDGNARWLELAVRTNGGGVFTALTPRQPITSTPYAMRALNLSSNALSAFSGPVSFSNPANSFSGTFSGDGSALTNLAGMGVSNAWLLGGNAGTTAAANFIGTTDNQALDLKVNNQRAFRMQPSGLNQSPNLIGGFAGNSVGPGSVGAAISGGGSIFPNVVETNVLFGAIGGGEGIRILSGASYSTIAGGRFNNIGDNSSGGLIGGGEGNRILGGSEHATTAGGFGNEISFNGDYCFIGGGYLNNTGSNALSSTIAGGEFNGISIDSRYSSIGGGRGNQVGENSLSATIAGGTNNLIGANSSHSGIGGGRNNTISSNSLSATIAGGRDNDVGDDSSHCVISGGYDNDIAANADYAAIAGGGNNSVGQGSIWSTIGGGWGNEIRSGADLATVAGGYGNDIGDGSGGGAIGGGYFNEIAASSLLATIGGGSQNTIGTNSDYSVISGGSVNRTGTNAQHAVIAGGYNNFALRNNTTIGGGAGNQVAADFATIAGGRNSVVAGVDSTVGGGSNNEVNTSGATISGGINNRIAVSSPWATISGGYGNTATGTGSVIGGGVQNATTNSYSTVGGGNANVASKQFATVPGGAANTADGNYAFAAGRRAKANHTGAFVWGDSSDADVVSTNNNSVTLRASGGYRLFSNTGASVGVFLAPGGNSWASISDRNAKKNFQPVDTQQVLSKLAGLLIQRWNYQSESDTAVPHIGPMAQDFKAAFYPGREDTTISTLEVDGVALAAIQGLNQKLEQKETEIAELKQAVNELTALVQAMHQQLNGGAK